MSVVRTWSARATRAGATAYAAYFRTALAPELEKLAGHRGALVLERPDGDLIEITVHTFWDSMAAIERFAGPAPERAVVEPEARALLAAFDDRVEHREIALDTR